MRIIWFRVRAALRGRAGDAGMSTSEYAMGTIAISSPVQLSGT